MDFIQSVCDYFWANHDHFLYLISGLSFLIELSIMGLSGPLLFFAIACLITGVMVSFGIVDTWQMEVLLVGVITALVALVLWKPLKTFQNQGSGKDTSSDMIGLRVPASEGITKQEGSIRYSGINWMARLPVNSDVVKIEKGELCEIIAVEGNTMIVKPFTPSQEEEE